MKIISKVMLFSSIITFFGIIAFTNPEPIHIAQSELGGLVIPMQSEPGGL